MNIVTLLNQIDSNDIVLPAIQRDFVWTEDKIAKLMDSIMRGYPVGIVLVQTSLRKAILRLDFWTFFYPMGESPTSIWSSFPAGVTTLSLLSFRQNCCWAARRLGC